MKIQLKPGTRIPIQDGLSDYGALVDVDQELGLALTTGPNPAGTEVPEETKKTKRA